MVCAAAPLLLLHDASPCLLPVFDATFLATGFSHGCTHDLAHLACAHLVFAPTFSPGLHTARTVSCVSLPVLLAHCFARTCCMRFDLRHRPVVRLCFAIQQLASTLVGMLTYYVVINRL